KSFDNFVRRAMLGHELPHPGANAVQAKVHSTGNVQNHGFVTQNAKHYVVWNLQLQISLASLFRGQKSEIRDSAIRNPKSTLLARRRLRRCWRMSVNPVRERTIAVSESCRRAVG